MTHEPIREDDKIRRLHSFISDLLSIQALSAIWNGRDSGHIISTLLDVLVRVLRLEFAYARLNDSPETSAVELVRLAQPRSAGAQPQAVGQALDRWLTNQNVTAPLAVPNPVGDGEVRIVPIHLGLQTEMGVLVAGAKRADFPTQTEMLLLRVAANQALVSLQEVRQFTEQKNAATTLERRVAHRTAQLTAVKDKLAAELFERKRAEEKLRRSEMYLAEGQRLSHTASWAWDVTSGEVFWSAEMFRIYGLDPQTYGPSYPDVLNYIHPEDRSRVQQTFEQAVREKREYELAYRVGWPDGTIRHVNNLAHPVFSASGELTEYVGTAMDVTERKQVEEALRENHERVEMILDSITDKFFAVDEHWRYTHFNKQAEEQLRQLGKDPARFLGKVLWEEFPNPPTEPAFRRAMSERVPIIAEHFYEPLGEWVENRIYPSPDGGLAMFVSYVTERKRAEEALQKLQTEFSHVTRVTTMGELAASIAHEINQPLGAIVNNGNACLSLLADTPVPDDVRHALADIVNDANRASTVIARVRALAKGSTPENVALDLKDVIGEVLTLAHQELAERRITVHSEFADEPSRVSGDRIQLQQVLLNLIMNAIEAMSAVDDSRRVLTIRTQRGELRNQPAVLITLQDTGCGFLAENAERLFEAFYTTKPHGTGLGLRISRSIVEAHGGRLWATAHDGPGAKFSCLLPRQGPS